MAKPMAPPFSIPVPPCFFSAAILSLLLEHADCPEDEREHFFCFSLPSRTPAFNQRTTKQASAPTKIL